MKAQDIVAIILAVCVMLFIGAGIMRAYLTQGASAEVVVDMWENIMGVIAGGLIGYIGGKRG